MAINKILYTVSALGLEPNTKQYCGMQGDHNVYELDFKIDSVLWNALQEKTVNGGTLYYRFDLYNGEGAMDSTQPQALVVEETTDRTISFKVEEWLTRFGGVGKVVLVITLSEDSITHLELYSFPALLQFKNRPTGNEPDAKEYQSITTLVETAKIASENAMKAAEKAEDSANQVTETNAILKNGFRMVLDGQRADAEMEFSEILDAEMSDSSENAVMNKVIKDYVDNKFLAAINNLITEETKKAIIEIAHPVGSIYWSSNETDPTNLFGGEWEQITDKFIIAASATSDEDGKYKVGAEGGKENVTLTAKQIAQHQHNGLWFGDKTQVNIQRMVDTPTTGVALHRTTNEKIYDTAALKTGNNEYGKDDDGNDIVQEPVNIMPPYIAYYCWIRTK